MQITISFEYDFAYCPAHRFAVGLHALVTAVQREDPQWDGRLGLSVQNQSERPSPFCAECQALAEAVDAEPQ